MAWGDFGGPIRYWLAAAALAVGCRDATREANAPSPVGRYQLAATPTGVVKMDTTTGQTWLLLQGPSDADIPRWTFVSDGKILRSSRGKDGILTLTIQDRPDNPLSPDLYWNTKTKSWQPDRVITDTAEIMTIFGKKQP